MAKKVLHMLQWKLTDIKKELPLVKEQGFDAIQISPIQGTRNESLVWWELYQNTNLRIGNTQIGDTHDLKDLCREAHELGLEIYADVLLHNVASGEDGKGIHRLVDAELLVYVDEKPKVKNWNDRYQTTHLSTGLPMCNYFDEGYQRLCIKFLRQLTNCGVDGFRIDQLKHFALPEEGSNFIPNVFGEFSDLYLYGEVLNAPQHIIDSYSRFTNVLTELRTTDKNKTVTFFESHDMYFHQWTPSRHWNQNELCERWAKLVREENVNAIFYARPFDDTWKCELMRVINREDVW